MNAKEIIANWNLKKHGFVDSSGAFTPTAPEMSGQLIYTADGAMCVLITKTPLVQKVADLIVYSGRYTVEGNRISHHIQIAPAPERRNTTEVRIAKLEGKQLTLTTEPTPKGHYQMVWERA